MSHSYHLVFNNPTPEDCLALENISNHPRYMTHDYAKGDAPTTGTPHIHAYIRFKTKQSFMNIKRLFPRAHIEPAYRDEVANRFYIDAHAGMTEEEALKSWKNSIKINK